jgi:hypothetical protein
MSAHDSMKCEECRELLTAIVCGEINARDEQRARAHTETCPACKATLGAFQHAIWAAAELPLDEPSAALDERVMAAAAAALEKRAPARKPRPAWWGDLGATLGRLGDWAMSPQVAMASVLVLVVGIGLYALPLHQPAERSALTTVNEAPEVEVPPDLEGTATGMPVPAADVATAAHERAELAPKGEGQGEGPRKASGGSGRFAPPPALSAKKSASSGGADAPALADDGVEAKVRAARTQQAEAEEAAPSTSKVPAKAAPKPASPPAPSAPAMAEPAAPAELSKDKAAPLGAAVADGLGGAGAGASADDRRERAADDSEAPVAAPSGAEAVARDEVAAQASAAVVSAPAPAKPVNERAELAKGMQALTAGRLPQAITVLTPLAQHGSDEVRDLAQSLLAEALHDAGRCKEAVVWYAKVVNRPSASPRSLELAADCYAKTGRDAKAAELRTRARAASKR